MGADDPYYGITRLESGTTGTFGWQVRLQRNGVRHVRFFADGTFSDAERALQRAREFRDRILRRLEQREAAIRVQTTSPRNTSGTVGVSRVMNVSSRGVSYFYWQATWSPCPGQRRCVRFSIARYGEEEAYLRACEARGRAVRDES